MPWIACLVHNFWCKLVKKFDLYGLITNISQISIYKCQSIPNLTLVMTSVMFWSDCFIGYLAISHWKCVTYLWRSTKDKTKQNNNEISDVIVVPSFIQQFKHHYSATNKYNPKNNYYSPN